MTFLLSHPWHHVGFDLSLLFLWLLFIICNCSSLHDKYSGKGVSLFLATTSCTWSPWVWDRPPWSWHCYSLLCSCQIQMSSKTQTRSCRSIWLFWPCRDPCMEIAGRSQVTGLQRWEDLGERRRWSSLFGLPDEQLKPQVCLQYRW